MLLGWVALGAGDQAEQSNMRQQTQEFYGDSIMDGDSKREWKKQQYFFVLNLSLDETLASAKPLKTRTYLLKTRKKRCQKLPLMQPKENRILTEKSH